VYKRQGDKFVPEVASHFDPILTNKKGCCNDCGFILKFTKV